MSRQNINRAFEMEVFIAVVAAEGFTAAAEPLGITASAVSKLINRLETRLGTKLLPHHAQAATHARRQRLPCTLPAHP